MPGELARRGLGDAHGEGAVAIGRVKDHVGMEALRKADEAGRLGAAKQTGGEVTEGGVRQAVRR